MNHILLVEDDDSLGATLKERLVKEGYRIDWVQTYSDATQQIKNQFYNLMILDVGLPDGTGFELAKNVKQQVMTPFIFLTAQGSAEDRLEGYELGAEEYIPKPFHLKELLLRVRHVLENHAFDNMRCADIEIDFVSRRISHESGHSELIADKDFQILKLLIQSTPRVVSRDEILDKIWGENQFPTNRTVDNVILRIRQALGTTASKYVKSVRGVGYQWLKQEGE